MKHKAKVTNNKNKIVVSSQKSTSIELLNQKNEVVALVKGENMAPEQIFFVDPGEYTVVSNGKIKSVKLEYEKIGPVLEMASLALSTDAKDFHKVDGIAEIPADGKSFATVFVEKMDLTRKPLNRVKDKDELFIRTNAGVVKDAEGKSDIRSVKLSKGKASFRLYSETFKRFATIQLISADPLLENASISIEFF